MYPRLFQFGHIAIPSYGVFAAIALVAALVLSMQTARRLALDPAKIWNLGTLGILSALLGSRLLLILFHLRDFFAHPFWMLGLTTVRDNNILAAAILFSICTCLGYVFAAGLPFGRTLDCLAPAVALGLAIRSIGALLAGSDYGSPTTTPWGVVYHHALAMLWSGTPLGVRVHPVQAYEALAFFALFIVLIFCISRSRSEDGPAGIFLLCSGTIFYFLDFFRGNRSFLFAGAITVSQLFGVLMLLAGATLLLWPKTCGHQSASV